MKRNVKRTPIEASGVPQWRAELRGERSAVFWCTEHARPVTRQTAHRHRVSGRECCYFKYTIGSTLWMPYELVLPTRLRPKLVAGHSHEEKKSTTSTSLQGEPAEGGGEEEGEGEAFNMQTENAFDITIPDGREEELQEETREYRVEPEMAVSHRVEDEDAGNVDDEVNDPPFNMGIDVEQETEGSRVLQGGYSNMTSTPTTKSTQGDGMLERSWTITSEHYDHPAALELACVIIENNLTQYTVDRMLWVMKLDSQHSYDQKYINSLCNSLKTVKEYQPGHNSICSFFHHILSSPMLSSRCEWYTRKSKAMGPIKMYTDLIDGSEFKELCDQHPEYDAEGRRIYTGALCLYIDSGEASSGSMAASNTIIHAYCGNLNRRLRNMEEFSCPLSIYRGAHRDVYKQLRIIIDELEAQHNEGTVMVDSAIEREVRVYIHLLLINADSQMRWIIGSVNPPSQSSASFGHVTDPRSLELCLMCHERRPNFGQAQEGRPRSYEESVDVATRLRTGALTQQERENVIRNAGLHKEVAENPLFMSETLNHRLFNPHQQITHDTLHTELLGNSKKLAKYVYDSTTPTVRELINNRVRALIRRGHCKRIDINQCQMWSGRDIRQFIRVAPVILQNIQEIPDDLYMCIELEAELLWYLTCPEWSTVLEGEFIQCYTQQRKLQQVLFPDDNSINQHNVCHVIENVHRFGPVHVWDAQIGEASMGSAGQYADHTSRWSCDFSLKRMTQRFSVAVWKAAEYCKKLDSELIRDETGATELFGKMIRIWQFCSQDRLIGAVNRALRVDECITVDAGKPTVQIKYANMILKVGQHVFFYTDAVEPNQGIDLGEIMSIDSHDPKNPTLHIRFLVWEGRHSTAKPLNRRTLYYDMEFDYKVENVMRTVDVCPEFTPGTSHFSQHSLKLCPFLGDPLFSS